MLNNPYTAFWAAMQQHSADAAGLPPVCEGVVTASEPLQVSVMGLPFGGGDLQVNEILLDPEKPLQKGNRVLCLSIDGWQTIYILCKVVAI